MSTSRDATYCDILPDHLPSILEYYQSQSNKLNASPSLSPGNGINKRFDQNDIRKSVVAVSTFRGVERMIDCSGIIVDWDNDGSTWTILTTAKVLRFPVNSMRELYHVIVRLFDGKVFEAKEDYVDFRLNVAILKIISTQTLQYVKLDCDKPYEDQMNVFVLGRSFFSLLIQQVSGVLLSHPPCFGCDELLSSTVRTYKIVEGGPFINDKGDVIGINFVDDEGYAHLLPNESICFMLFATKRCIRNVVYPWFGLTVIDAHNVSYDARELMGITSDNERRLFVKEVYSGSPAEKLGISRGDHIISYGGSTMYSSEKYLQELFNVSELLSANQEKLNFEQDNSLPPLVIRKRINNETVCVEPYYLPGNDKSFCVCWPFNDKIWSWEPLEGSQRGLLMSGWWSPNPATWKPVVDSVANVVPLKGGLAPKFAQRTQLCADNYTVA